MNTNTFDTGISIAITGYIIVFAALTILYFSFNLMPKIVKIFTNKSTKIDNECSNKDCPPITGNVVAAISMAIHLYMNEKHDNESYDLTIKKISKRYSPWSSKIYSMNNLNKKG